MTDPKDPDLDIRTRTNTSEKGALLKDIDPDSSAAAGVVNKEEETRHTMRNSKLADDKFQRAVEAVKEAGEVSTPFVMQALELDYNQASRIMEKMVAEGMIGLPDPTGVREIYWDKF